MRPARELISHICHIEYGEMSIALGIRPSRRRPRLISTVKTLGRLLLILFIVSSHSHLFHSLAFITSLLQFRGASRSSSNILLCRYNVSISPRGSVKWPHVRLIWCEAGQRRHWHNQTAVIGLSWRINLWIKWEGGGRGVLGWRDQGPWRSKFWFCHQTAQSYSQIRLDPLNDLF